MFDEVIKKILESINEKSMLTEMYPKFSGEGYRAHKIDVKNFHEIKKSNSDKKIAFIDGGNAEILGSANFSLNLIRVCFIVYKNNKKILSKRFDIFSFIKAVNENNEICYEASFFNVGNSISIDEISFSSFDHTLMNGINRAEIGSAANAIRRFVELKIAKSISDSKSADVIVLDGNLQSTMTHENKYLNDLYESCSENNVILSAISKTNSLFTDNGNLLSAVLMGISKLPVWYYHPIAEINNHNHKAELFFAKFHLKSKYVFSFEIFNIQKMIADKVINELASNCCDPIFVGYPYGLVEADRIARVSNQEKESLKTMFLVKLRNKNIEKYLNAANAHEILDKISF
ncbi:MAG TPA: DNA double-strand break repair nuclease NurA [Candidatus Nanoarchaeia archaeon]|nr:DNA double-strand break repair nuclease NurA [Candidatus Nanoarchaeia archaeon]